jgi:hypothetical protein
MGCCPTPLTLVGHTAIGRPIAFGCLPWLETHSVLAWTRLAVIVVVHENAGQDAANWEGVAARAVRRPVLALDTPRTIPKVRFHLEPDNFCCLQQLIGPRFPPHPCDSLRTPRAPWACRLPQGRAFRMAIARSALALVSPERGSMRTCDKGGSSSSAASSRITNCCTGCSASQPCISAARPPLQ